MSLDEAINLKLIGKNQEDLKVISAYLQDSVVTVKDMVFLKNNRIFVMIVNRFMWEDVEGGVFRQNKRIRCAIKFEEIFKIRSKNINQKRTSKILECLAINSNLNIDEIYKIKIFFSGGSAITLFAEAIDVAMHDLGKPWNVKHIPRHDI
tara:strand:- start:316 stop:765 length:450 start_codon:yes stop_codon:yes gene_type:complete